QYLRESSPSSSSHYLPVSNHFHAACSLAHCIMGNPPSHAPPPTFTSIGADTWQTLRRFHVWENTDMQLPPAVRPVVPFLRISQIWLLHKQRRSLHWRSTLCRPSDNAMQRHFHSQSPE
ncbi:Glycoprotein UL1, partial [Dissostichus eleginoides]